MILITGAAGKTGRSVIGALSGHETICAFVARADQRDLMAALGVEKIIVGDLREKTAVRSAMKGIRAVYHICPNMSPDEAVIGKLMIEAAQEQGVEHFVYHSVLHPQTEKMNHHWQKLQVEEMLFEGGLPFTILQPAPYMQNLLSGWKSIVDDGILHVPYSIDSKFSFVDLKDVAEVAKIVLTEPQHTHAIYELAGTGPISHREVAEIFSQVLKREVRAENEEIGDWKLRAERSSEGTQSKRDRYLIENLVRMFEYYDQWGLAGNPNVLRWLLKREPTSFESFVERTVKEIHAN